MVFLPLYSVYIIEFPLCWHTEILEKRKKKEKHKLAVVKAKLTLNHEHASLNILSNSFLSNEFKPYTEECFLTDVANTLRVISFTANV